MTNLNVVNTKVIDGRFENTYSVVKTYRNKGITKVRVEITNSKGELCRRCNYTLQQWKNIVNQAINNEYEMRLA